MRCPVFPCSPVLPFSCKKQIAAGSGGLACSLGSSSSGAVLRSHSCPGRGGVGGSSRSLPPASSGTCASSAGEEGERGSLLAGVTVSPHEIPSATSSSALHAPAPGSEVWECRLLTLDLPHGSSSKRRCPKSAGSDSSLIPTAWLVKRSESTNRNWPDKRDFFFLFFPFFFKFKMSYLTVWHLLCLLKGKSFKIQLCSIEDLSQN